MVITMPTDNRNAFHLRKNLPALLIRSRCRLTPLISLIQGVSGEGEYPMSTDEKQPTQTPFEKFQALTRKLVAVPREELAKAQARYGKQREKHPQSDRKPMLRG